MKLAGEVVDFDIAADGETVYYVKNFEEKEKSASLYRYSVAQGEAEKLSSDTYTLGIWASITAAIACLPTERPFSSSCRCRASETPIPPAAY